MNFKITVFFLLTICQTFLAQTGSTFFPSQTGYKWHYESVPLDSLSNPVNSQKFYSIDSFSVITSYNGKNANVVLSKTGPQNTLNFQSYTDSIYYNFESSNGFEYFNPELFSGLPGNVDTTLGIDFLNFFNSLKGWYSYYRFASSVNTSYQIFSKDTTVTINSTTLPLRFELIGQRLSDETINTSIGIFACKKFLLERRLSYLVFNIIPIKILGVEETLWLAPENWIVKSYIPSTNVDLSVLGILPYNIPGLETKIILPITNVENEFLTINNFELYQNYPNPFNPNTSIKYAISSRQFVTIQVYDILGNEVATLVNEEKPAGRYEIEFNLSAGRQGAASGIYFYQLRAGDYIEAKKMILLK